jgi:uncharacterized heparinase superfamily protein
MRDGETHVFIDCGPVGLAGRGGHGHNDALSFEACIEGVPLVTDCGSYVYTASFEARNRFRSTVSHNTPFVDSEEINRFAGSGNLWNLHDDARPICLEWRTDALEDVFIGSHHGYVRLGVEVRRTIRFDKATRSLEITDELSGEGPHDVSIPFHFFPGVAVEQISAGWKLQSAGMAFNLVIESAQDWTGQTEPCLVSPSYGVSVPSQRLVFSSSGSLPKALKITISPIAIAQSRG